MTALARGLVAAAFLATADAASAHTVFGVTGFPVGLLHPLFVPTHSMAVTVLALMIGQQGGARAIIAVYAVAVLAGLGVIFLAYVPTMAEQASLACAAITGLLVALGRRLPRAMGLLLAAATGLALALDSPPEAILVRDANWALIGTALGAPLALLALVQGTSRLTSDWQRIGARIAGSWIAASAILVLALRAAG